MMIYEMVKLKANNDMKVYEIQEWIEQALNKYGSDVDVFVEGSDGLLHDFKIDEMPEMFDGFDTVTPPGYKFVMTD